MRLTNEQLETLVEWHRKCREQDAPELTPADKSALEALRESLPDVVCELLEQRREVVQVADVVRQALRIAWGVFAEEHHVERVVKSLGLPQPTVIQPDPPNDPVKPGDDTTKHPVRLSVRFESVYRDGSVGLRVQVGNVEFNATRISVGEELRAEVHALLVGVEGFERADDSQPTVRQSRA